MESKPIEGYDTSSPAGVPEGYVMIQDSVLDLSKCSKNILIQNSDRTAVINPYHETDGNVKTVLGSIGMERPKA